MNYRGYNFKLSGVYKMENKQKFYSLEIYQNENLIFKTDWIYENEKRAFKDAKAMIKNQRFDTEIIRENTNKENLKNDTIYIGTRNKKIVNIIIIFLYIALIISFILSLFGINDNIKDFEILVWINFCIGMLFSVSLIFYGLFVKGSYTLTNKQKKAYSIIWLISLIFNKGPYIAYNDQPFENLKKGWSSAQVLAFLVVEIILLYIILFFCINNNTYSLLFYDTIACGIILFGIYIFTIIWEINDAKSNGECFPFNKVITPIISILLFILIIYFGMKIFY